MGFLRGIFATLLLHSERVHEKESPGEPFEKPMLPTLPMLATQNTEPTTRC